MTLIIFSAVLLPAEFFTVKVTVYVPFLVYVCRGFLTCEVFLSPKSQDLEVIVPLLLSVNFTVKGAFPEIGVAQNAATGVLNLHELFTVMLTVSLLDNSPSLTVRVIFLSSAAIDYLL